MTHIFASDVDKRIEKLFESLCLYLSFNPSNSERYRELHRYLLEWITLNYSYIAKEEE